VEQKKEKGGKKGPISDQKNMTVGGQNRKGKHPSGPNQRQNQPPRTGKKKGYHQQQRRVQPTSDGRIRKAAQGNRAEQRKTKKN